MSGEIPDTNAITRQYTVSGQTTTGDLVVEIAKRDATIDELVAMLERLIKYQATPPETLRQWYDHQEFTTAIEEAKALIKKARGE